MNTLKTAAIGAALTLMSVPAIADAVMVDALIQKQLEQVFSKKMDQDANFHLFSIPVGENGVIDRSLGAYDADYEGVLASRGTATGTAIYGQNDADYEAFLTPDNFFATAALGQYDADYEVILEARAPLGPQFFQTAGLGEYDADYEVILAAYATK